jgi:hypothetical protein
MKIYKYYVCTNPDRWSEGQEYSNPREAKCSAQLHGKCVVEAVFEFQDSELIEDHRQGPNSQIEKPK